MNNALWFRMSRSVVYTLCALLSLQVVSYGEDLKPEQVYQKALPSIATLIVEKADDTQSIGNAFLGVKDGIGITAWHVIEGAKKVTAKFSNGEEFEVSGLIDKDEKSDIALIRINVSGRKLLTLNPTDPPVGSKAYVIGAPQGLEFSVSEGLLSQIQTLDGVKYYQFGCPASSGNSGGPLVNSVGEVLGVVSWQLRDGQNLNFAVPASYALSLDSMKPDKPWTSLLPVVTPQSIEVPKIASTDNDEILADAFQVLRDCVIAIGGTAHQFFKPLAETKSDIFTGSRQQWKLQTPSYLYTCHKRNNDITAKLSSISYGGTRGQAKSRIISHLRETSVMCTELISLIKTLQQNEGWSPQSQDEFARIFAEKDADTLLPGMVTELMQSNSFRSRFTRDVQSLYLSGEFNWEAFGITSFDRKPMEFIVIREESLAYKLGYRSADILLSVQGIKIEGRVELMELIQANVGKTVKSEVLRNGKVKKLNIKIPKSL